MYDKKKVKDAIQEISNSMTRIEAERDNIKGVIDAVSKSEQLDKKAVRTLANLWHRQSFDEERTFHEEIESMYESLNSSNS